MALGKNKDTERRNSVEKQMAGDNIISVECDTTTSSADDVNTSRAAAGVHRDSATDNRSKDTVSMERTGGTHKVNSNHPKQ